MTEPVEPTIIYDVVTKSVLVTSGHRIKLLPGPYESRAKALAAGKKSTGFVLELEVLGTIDAWLSSCTRRRAPFWLSAAKAPEIS